MPSILGGVETRIYIGSGNYSSYIFFGHLANAFIKASILGEVEIPIFIGALVFILYSMYLFILLILLTPDKRVYKAVYFRVG